MGVNLMFMLMFLVISVKSFIWLVFRILKLLLEIIFLATYRVFGIGCRNIPNLLLLLTMVHLV